MTTNQPKWHYTFDGLLWDQYNTFRGWAGKAEDYVERQHQVWEKLGNKYRHFTNFERCERLKRREMWRSLHPYLQYYENLLTTAEDNDKERAITSKKRKSMDKFVNEQRQKAARRWNSVYGHNNRQHQSEDQWQPPNVERDMLLDIDQAGNNDIIARL